VAKNTGEIASRLDRTGTMNPRIRDQDNESETGDEIEVREFYLQQMATMRSTVVARGGDVAVERGRPSGWTSL